MSGIVIPIVTIELPCIFDKIDDNAIDYASLGIINEDKKETEIDLTTFQIDQINGFSPFKENGVSCTVIWAFGYRFTCNMIYSEFKKVYNEAIEQYNRMFQK